MTCDICGCPENEVYDIGGGGFFFCGCCYTMDGGNLVSLDDRPLCQRKETTSYPTGDVDNFAVVRFFLWFLVFMGFVIMVKLIS